jgi:hypothetical protein
MGLKPGLTEDGILPQIEVAFAEVDFVAAPRRARAGSVNERTNAHRTKKVSQRHVRTVSERSVARTRSSARRDRAAARACPTRPRGRTTTFWRNPG